MTRSHFSASFLFVTNSANKMITKFLNGLEDPRRPLLGPNYWILERMGLVLPENKFGRVAYISLHAFVTLFVFSQYMELYVIRTDLDQILTNLKISMLSIVCVVKANTFVFWQKDWRKLIDYVCKADKYERESKDPIIGSIVDSYTQYCRRVIYFYWILVCMTVITVVNTPLLRYLSSTNYREALYNGTEPFPHIFSAWVPFDKYSGPGYWLTVLFHTFMCMYGGGIMAAYDTSVVAIMVFIGGKLDLLRERCRQIFGTNDQGVSEKQATATIKELHDIHNLLMR